jgi:hypothetical protein
MMSGVSRANALALAGTLIFLGHGAASAPFGIAQGVPSPPLKTVLERAGAYVESSPNSSSGIVAEEVMSRSSGGPRRHP